MKVVIVGGVAGGAGAAARLRRNDEQAEIILFERGQYISFANCGLPYYLGGVIQDEAELLLYTPETFKARSNVDVRVRSEVIAVNTQKRSVRVKDLNKGTDYEESYDKLILSPGARAVRPPIEGLLQPHVFVLRSMEDCQAIAAHLDTCKPKTVAVIGAGFIGLEMAENLHARGLAVSVIEAAPSVMGPLDADMAAEVQNHIRSKNVQLHLNAFASKVGANTVTLKSGETVPADCVLLSAGVAPDTAFLKGSGIIFGERGEILVNDRMETNVPDVLAVGDAVSITNIVTGKQQTIALAGPAAKQARIAADVVCGMPARYAGGQGTAIAKVFDMTVALTGLGETALQKTDLAFLKSVTVSQSHAGYYPGATPLTVKILFHPESGLLYGAQITGQEGVDKRIDVLATALRAKMTVYDLQELELAYAPPYSSSKDPVNIAGYMAGSILEKRSKVLFAAEVDEAAQGAALLDIRNPDETALGMAPGATNIPLPELRSKLHTLDKNKPVHVMCQIGLRGHLGAEILRHSGFSVSNVLGGYMQYKHVSDDRIAKKK